MQIKKDDNIVYKISYTPPPSKNKNMIFIASCTIMIPEQINGDSCQVSIKSKTREITNAWLTVTALNSNEVAVASEDKKLEHPEWTDNVPVSYTHLLNFQDIKSTGHYIMLK